MIRVSRYLPLCTEMLALRGNSRHCKRRNLPVLSRCVVYHRSRPGRRRSFMACGEVDASLSRRGTSSRERQGVESEDLMDGRLIRMIYCDVQDEYIQTFWLPELLLNFRKIKGTPLLLVYPSLGPLAPRIHNSIAESHLPLSLPD